jgi:hypothetical protein
MDRGGQRRTYQVTRQAEPESRVRRPGRRSAQHRADGVSTPSASRNSRTRFFEYPFTSSTPACCATTKT